MLLFVFVAIAGGLATGAAMAPFGPLIAVLSVPLGGSICAAVAALVVWRLRGPAFLSEADRDAQTDAMVADLRGIADRARRRDAAPPESRPAGRDVA
ncbi:MULTISPECIES: hypothetical protein [Methylobacterium]|uniref:hypothetical protein n=1 Tax=Methylobacterium TaxID=407 RepID=UPI0013ECA479|nr:hypothetical protein [Methylobacterium sp. DB0501]NGM37560.1 hypothetical protein [Methylobacterium sp. DB0501]